MIISDGSDSNISTSSSLAFGKILSKSSNIGDIANPGNDTIADTESIATNTTTEISPFPVFTFITSLFARYVQ
jgi:hypothetical protein